MCAVLENWSVRIILSSNPTEGVGVLPLCVLCRPLASLSSPTKWLIHKIRGIRRRSS
jgi:hypothetical protein